MLKLVFLCLFGALSVDGLGPPDYASGMHFHPHSGHLKLGVSGKITKRSGCGATRMVAAARAVYDVNTRNSKYCPAIANLGPASMFNVSIDFLDNVGSGTLAITAGLYYANLKRINGNLNGVAVHGLLGMTTSGASLASANSMAALDLPMVCYSATSPSLSGRSAGSLLYPNFFRVVPGDQNRVAAAARVIHSLGYTAAVSLYFSDTYTSTMCESFRAKATSLGVFVTSKELPTAGNSGGVPGAIEKARIETVLKQIRDDPTMPRVIMLCAFDDEVPEVMAQALSLGMRTKQSGYLWMIPDDGTNVNPTVNNNPIKDADTYLGIFVTKWQTHSARSDIFKADFDSGLIPITQNFEYMFSQPICGDDQSTVCWNEPNTTADPSLNYFLYNGTARTSFDSCKTYTQFGYDAVVMYAMAMHKGITAGTFTKDTVTSALLESTLKTLVGDESYGECLSPGEMTFNADQERNLPFLLYNVIKSGGINKLQEVANIPALDNQAITWSNGNLIQCSQDASTPCATATAPIIMNATEKLSAGAAPDSMPRGLPPRCHAGEYFHNGECTPAPTGYYAPLAAAGAWVMTPTKCSPGTFTATPGLSSCTSASVGSAAKLDQTGESPCLVGEYSGERQAATCSKCSPGDYQDQTNQSSCKRCPIGQYINVIGQSSCIACPAGKTTEFPGSSALSDCICPEGEYLVHTSNTCSVCPTGIDCPLGSTTAFALGSSATALRVREGYYVKPDPASIADAVVKGVYSCDVLGESLLGQDGYFSPCPGGGAGSCAPGRDSTTVACGSCQADYFRRRDGTCGKCDGYEPILLVIAIMLGICLPVGAYFFINSPVTARLSELGMAVLSFGSFITNLQLAAVISRLSVSWPAGLRDLFGVLSLFAFDLDAVRGDCLFGGGGTTSLVVTLLIPCMLCCVLFGVSALSRRIYPTENKLHMKFPETFNTFFTVYQAVFIAILLTIVRPLRCYQHPNGESSMVDYPNVLCWDSGHTPLVLLSAVAFSIEIFLFIAYYSWGILTLPKSSTNDPVLVRKLKFIVYRFREGAWYWGILFLARNTITGMAVIVDPGQPYAQVMLLSITLVIYLGFLVGVWPWKSMLLNLADALGTGALICMLIAACPAVATMSDSLADQVTHLAIIFWVIGVGVNVAFVCYGISCWYKQRMGGSAYQETKLKQRLESVQATSKALNDVAVEVAKLPVNALNTAMSDVGETDLFRLKQVLVFLQIEFLSCDTFTAAHHLGFGSFAEGSIGRRISDRVADVKLARMKSRADKVVPFEPETEKTEDDGKGP